MAIYKIAGNDHDPVDLTMKTYNTSTGLVLTTANDFGGGFIFSNPTDRNNAITLINGNPTNASNGFIGQIPKGHP